MSAAHATSVFAPTSRHERPADPDALLGWLTGRFGLVFTQDVNALIHAGSGQPLGRIQVTRAMTGGELHDHLLTGEN